MGKSGQWRTKPHVVTLSDGTRKSVYAESEHEAMERMQRMLTRHGSHLTAVAAQAWKPN